MRPIMPSGADATGRFVARLPRYLRAYFDAREGVGWAQPPQTQALEPESAQISAAIRSCSAFGASCGLPWPP